MVSVTASESLIPDRKDRRVQFVGRWTWFKPPSSPLIGPGKNTKNPSLSIYSRCGRSVRPPWENSRIDDSGPDSRSSDLFISVQQVSYLRADNFWTYLLLIINVHDLSLNHRIDRTPAMSSKPKKRQSETIEQQIGFVCRSLCRIGEVSCASFVLALFSNFRRVFHPNIRRRYPLALDQQLSELLRQASNSHSPTEPRAIHKRASMPEKIRNKMRIWFSQLSRRLALINIARSSATYVELKL